MAKGPSDKAGKKGGSIVIKKEEVVEGGHHGGAWKVAYADFVTAMMAFFLLMWLLNATTEEQKRGLADYFSPTSTLARSMSGSGAPLGGKTPYDNGSMVSDRGSVSINNDRSPPTDVEDDGSDTPAQPTPNRAGGTSPTPTADQNASGQGGQAQGTQASGNGSPGMGANAAQNQGAGTAPANAAQVKAELERQEKAAFSQAATEIKQALNSDPALAELSHQLSVDMTPEGLRIQLLDEEKLPMFSNGSSGLSDRARLVLQKVAPALMKLSEPLSIAGYTDAIPYRGSDRSNWELSADRANSTRRLLVDAGLQETRVQSVTAHADRDLLLPQDPTNSANRRIAIVVLRDPLSRVGAQPPAANKEPPQP